MPIWAGGGVCSERSAALPDRGQLQEELPIRTSTAGFGCVSRTSDQLPLSPIGRRVFAWFVDVAVVCGLSVGSILFLEATGAFHPAITTTQLIGLHGELAINREDNPHEARRSTSP